LTRFGGRRQDGGNRGFNDGRWKGGSWDVLKSNVLSKIVSKVLVDEGVLGGHREKVLFLVLPILGFIEGDVGEGLKTEDRGGGNGGASDDVRRAVRDVEEGVILWVVEDGPGKLGGWGTWDRNNG